MKKGNFTQVKEDISKKTLESVRITPFKEGYNIDISAYRLEKDDEGKTFRYGSGYIFDISKAQLEQFKEAISQIDSKKQD